MPLTTAQRSTLRADILADPALSAVPNTPDGAFEIAAVYNREATPTFFVWKTSVEVADIMQNGFDWTRVDNLTVGRARIWEWMSRTGTIRPNQSNVRAGILATFSAVQDSANRLAAFTHCARSANRVEKLFATGAGLTPTDQGVGPATMGFEGTLSYQDVLDARNS